MGRILNVWNALRGRPIRSESNPARDRIRNRFTTKANEIRARYDAAAFTPELNKHFLYADDLSAKTANSYEVRATLRRRGRYEEANNSYLTGMVNTFANELVGTGPRLQLQTSNEKANRQIERLFGEWMAATDMAAKLRLFIRARLVDGELFGILTNNPAIENDVTLDLKPVEADQVCTPFPDYGDITAVDGIRFDRYGNPKEYDVLPYHPGGQGEFGHGWYANYTPDVIQARYMLHFFRVSRAGQARGIPDITPALPLYGQLRRYTLAVLAAAELAACFAAIIKTELPAGDAPSDVVPFELIDIVKGMMQTLPGGASMEQFRAEQPVTTYSEFVNQILREACRCIEMPFSIATGDSSDNSYAGGRLEVQSWQRKVGIERNTLARALNRLFNSWAEEASAITGYIPAADLGPYRSWKRTWMWDGFKHVDPAKEANANDTALKNLSLTLEELFSAQGYDWVEKLEQIGREFKKCKELGIPHPSEQAAPAPEIPIDAPTAETTDKAKQEVADAVPA